MVEIKRPNLYDGDKKASDVDWNRGEIPFLMPNGHSEGLSIVRMKDGGIGIVRRSESGYHCGVKVLNSELAEMLKNMLK